MPHPEIVATVNEAVARLDHLHSSFLSDVVIDFADALSELLPESLSRVLPLSTGGESNEAALRMAQARDGPLRDRRLRPVMARRDRRGVRGDVQRRAARLRGTGARRSGAADASPLPLAVRVQWRVRLALGTRLGVREHRPPVHGQPRRHDCRAHIELRRNHRAAGGVSDGTGRALPRARGMLLVFDEAQTGLGRTGTRFAFEHEGVVPDILTLSKTLGAGLPLSATVASAEVEQTCYENDFLFYTTHAADPLPRGGRAQGDRDSDPRPTRGPCPRARAVHEGHSARPAAAPRADRRRARPRPA